MEDTQKFCKEVIEKYTKWKCQKEENLIIVENGTLSSDWETLLVGEKGETVAEEERYVRARKLVHQVHDLVQQSGIRLGQKYIVEQNSLQDPGIDYLSLEAEAFEHRGAYNQNQISDNPVVYYPKGGCVGNVVEFECIAEKRFRLTHTAEGSEEARWVFKGLKLCIKVVALSKYGAVPYEECFHLSSETDSAAKVLEQFRSGFLDREGYVLRPITEKENAVFLTVEPDDYYLDSRLGAVMLGPFERCRLEKEFAECFYDDETDSYIPLVSTIPLCRFDWAMRPMDPSIFEDD